MGDAFCVFWWFILVVCIFVSFVVLVVSFCGCGVFVWGHNPLAPTPMFSVVAPPASFHKFRFPF